MRSVDADIRDREVKACYEASFLSESLPGVALSENTVATFLKETGKEYSLIRRFLTERARRFAGRKQVIDGTLKDGNSTENGFSEFSRKGRAKGGKDLSLLCSFDLESKEPVLIKVYSSNVVDKRSIADFVATFSVRNAILAMDRGFCGKANAEALGKIEGLKDQLPGQLQIHPGARRKARRMRQALGFL